MDRRIYFVLPDPQHARQVVNDLTQGGVERSDIHALARSDVDLFGLPVATEAQRRDTVWRAERLLWCANQGLFWLAAAGLLASSLYGSGTASVLTVGVMVATFTAGALFAIKVPNVHLDEFRDAIAAGEVLLMVDVPRGQVARTEQNVKRRHPEATPGGVGWTVQALGA